MNRNFCILILLAAAAFSFGSEQTTAVGAEGNSTLSKSELRAMEQQLETITDPAARLFFQANIERAKGDPEQALQTLSKLIVHHAHSKTWIARSELMSAALYIQLGMLDAADVTARQIQALYEGTETAEKATVLRAEIEKLKETVE